MPAPFFGEIEVDESDFGGHRKGLRFWNQAKRHMRRFNGVPTPTSTSS